jgi:hypothetical protein
MIHLEQASDEYRYQEPKRQEEQLIRTVCQLSTLCADLTPVAESLMPTDFSINRHDSGCARCATAQGDIDTDRAAKIDVGACPTFP